MTETITAREHAEEFPDVKLPDDWLVVRSTEDHTLWGGGEDERCAWICFRLATIQRKFNEKLVSAYVN